MFSGIDRSQRLSGLIKGLSAGLARRRGLPIIIACALTIVSLILHVLLAIFPNNVLLLVCGLSALHIAILVGFIGVLLIEPLGRG